MLACPPKSWDANAFEGWLIIRRDFWLAIASVKWGGWLIADIWVFIQSLLPNQWRCEMRAEKLGGFFSTKERKISSNF